MELSILCFCFAWALRHWWDGRKNDARNPRNDYTRNVRNPAVRGASRRYALGWGLYQVRHGGPAMKQDVVDGWKAAHAATEKWRKGEAERPGFAQAWREGWRGGAVPGGGDPVLLDGASDGNGNNRPAPQPIPAASAPTIVVINNPPGGTMTTPTINAGEMTSLDAYRRLLQETVAAATHRLETAATDVAAAERDIATYDAAQASLAAYGLGPQTTGGLADLLEAAQSRKRYAEVARTRAEQELVTAQNVLAALVSTGQDAMQEAATAATERANDTNFYARQ